MANKHDDQMARLNAWFKVGTAQASAQRKLMKEDLEFYYADVEGTRTQLTQEQLSFIDDQYKIPISTKISWAIIEQMTAFLTGGKPIPRLIATTQNLQEFSNLYSQAFTALWYECHMNREIALVIKEALAGGLSFVKVRPNDFYSESTFGVVSEYVPYYKVFVDPHSEKPDFSDAEWICHADVLPKDKAEKKYDITLKDEFGGGSMTGMDAWSLDTNQVAHELGWPMISPDGMKDNKYVWVREFFSKQQANVYIGSNGSVGSKRPKPLEIPNPAKQELLTQIEALRAQAQAGLEQAKQASAEIGAAQELAAQPDTTISEAVQVGGASQRRWDEVSAQMDEMTAQISQLEQEYVQMPDFVTAFELETLTGEKEVVDSYFRKSQKFVKRWLCVGDQIVEQGLIPCDEYPLIPFSICQNNRPDKIYGIMHFIKDIVKAMNKFWSLMIYDMQTSAYRKVFYFAGSVTNPAKAERDFSRPMSWIEVRPNDSLPEGGMPKITEPGNLNPALERIIGLLQQMMEYITGISSLMQGQPTQATPDTFGGIQTMQSFGTERIKLYSRWLEDAMERLAYVTVSYLQAYAPKDEVITYLDDDGDQHELTLLRNTEDIKFKVRMNMTSALPTTRHMAAQLMGVLSGQSADPNMQALLQQYMVDYMDIPEGQKMRKEMDVVKNLSAQMEQMQSELESIQTENAQLKQQMFQKDLNEEYVKASADLSAQKQIAEAEIKDGEASASPIDAVVPEPPPEEPPF